MSKRGWSQRSQRRAAGGSRQLTVRLWGFQLDLHGASLRPMDATSIRSAVVTVSQRCRLGVGADVTLRAPGQHAQWALLEPLLPRPPTRGGPRFV
jgi:hypothetical protein